MNTDLNTWHRLSESVPEKDWMVIAYFNFGVQILTGQELELYSYNPDDCWWSYIPGEETCTAKDFLDGEPIELGKWYFNTAIESVFKPLSLKGDKVYGNAIEVPLEWPYSAHINKDAFKACYRLAIKKEIDEFVKPLKELLK